MTGRILGCVALCGWLLASSSLQAHHSLGGVYDVRKEGELSGTLVKISFTNPHGALHLAVKNADGTTTEWVLTTGSVTTLAERGIGKSVNTFKAGDTVSVKYFPARNGSPLGFLRSVTLSDGRTIKISDGSASD
jgi:hypothetical protein